MVLKAFPKIWALGNRAILDIFNYDVEITEKVDGSQFVFGIDRIGQYYCRSKGVMIDPNNSPDLFRPVVNWSRTKVLDEVFWGFAFYGETLCRPKHNSLEYSRVPKNNFALFGVSNFEGDRHTHDFPSLYGWAKTLDSDVVKLLYKGRADFNKVKELLGQESFLGGTKAEGVVVKAGVSYELFGTACPLMCGKFVTEEFKEVHAQNTEFKSGKSQLQDLIEQYRTEARWRKAVQFLRDNNELLQDPKDIGQLMKRVNQDIEEECREDIKEKLWTIYRKDIIKGATAGLPQWYKTELATGELK